KSGERPSTIMSRIAKGYSKKEIDLMADYFSKQAFIRQPQEFDANKASFGKKLHKKYCEKCHEDEGRSPDDDAGILAGQWEPYMRNTMEDYTSGKRPMEKKMKKRMKNLDDDHGDKGLDALIHYYTSLHQQ
ncbi:c-type cytochrome, partial [Kaarinaea lacus]